MKRHHVIILFFLAAAVVILCWPAEVRPNLGGSWTLEEVKINGVKQSVGTTVEITQAGFNIDFSSIHGIINNTRETYGIVELSSDSLSIYAPGGVLNDRYKINYSRQVEGVGQGAAFLLKLTLVSNSKTINLYRNERIKWRSGPMRKGTP